MDRTDLECGFILTCTELEKMAAGVCEYGEKLCDSVAALWAQHRLNLICHVERMEPERNP
jgi:hypothetical protein